MVATQKLLLILEALVSIPCCSLRSWHSQLETDSSPQHLLLWPGQHKGSFVTRKHTATHPPLVSWDSL